MPEALFERFEPHHQPTQLIDRATIGHPNTAYRVELIAPAATA
jgi:hypothetical protein